MLVTTYGRALSLGMSALLAVGIGGCAASTPSFNAHAAQSQTTGALASSSFRIADSDFDRDPRAVDADSALADLDAALRIFDEAYAGLEGKPRLPAASKIAEARARLSATPRWEPRAFAGELRDLLGQPDGHLAFGYGGHAPLRLSAIPAREPLGATDLLRRVSAVGEEPRPAFTLAAMTTTASFSVPSHAAKVSVTWDGVPTLAIRTFDSAARGELEKLPTIAARLRRAPAFVVDLRGNGGGNYAYAEAFALALTDRSLLRLDEREVRSAAAAYGRANSARRRLVAGEVPEAARGLYEAHIAALEADARAATAEGTARAELVVHGATVRGRAPGPLEGRAVFLVDRGCASACEMLLSLARQIPGVIVAGENTYGGMAVGEVAFFQLPASGVTLSLGTRAFRDPLGDFVEARGFLPDVWLDGRSALASAQHLALEGPGARLARSATRSEHLAPRALAGSRATLTDATPR